MEAQAKGDACPTTALPSMLDGPSLSSDKKRSRIYEYCIQAEQLGQSKCIWVCHKQGARKVASDIWLDDHEHQYIDLKKQETWLRRFSFYHVTRAKAVEVRTFVPNIVSANRMTRFCS